MKLEFFVIGVPAPGGSKRFVGHSKETGRAILIDAAGEKNKTWRNTVAWTASQAYPYGDLLAESLKVHFEFRMPRPKRHYGTKGLKSSAPKWPNTKPDALKLARSTEDALTGVVWKDDSYVVCGSQDKVFAEDGRCGCMIIIQTME